MSKNGKSTTDHNVIPWKATITDVKEGNIKLELPSAVGEKQNWRKVLEIAET